MAGGDDERAKGVALGAVDPDFVAGEVERGLVARHVEFDELVVRIHRRVDLVDDQLAERVGIERAHVAGGVADDAALVDGGDAGHARANGGAVREQAVAAGVAFDVGERRELGIEVALVGELVEQHGQLRHAALDEVGGGVVVRDVAAAGEDLGTAGDLEVAGGEVGEDVVPE